MAKTLGKISDFLIRIIMMFSTIMVLIFFANKYVEQQLVFAFLAFLFVIAIITKGMVDIFSKN